MLVSVVLIALSGYPTAELCRRSAPLASVGWERNSKRYVFLYSTDLSTIYENFVFVTHIRLCC